MITKQMICNGEFVAPHGVRGEIRLYPYSDDAEQYLNLKKVYLEDGSSQTIESIRNHKRVFVVKLVGVTNPNEAEKYRGKKVYIAKSDLPELPEGEYFHFEIIGLAVFHQETGERIGVISQVLNTGANDVYEITPEVGKPILIPAIREVVKKFDVPNGRMEIIPQKEWWVHENIFP